VPSAIKQVAARVAIFRVWWSHVIRGDSFFVRVEGEDTGVNACVLAGSPMGLIGKREGITGIKREYRWYRRYFLAGCPRALQS
jgi:hypothetical protein